MTPEPLSVQELNERVIQEVRAIAQAMPYRLERGVDQERVFWIDVAGRERIGLAYAPAPEGAYWMIAFSRTDGGKVTRGRMREVAALVAGRGARLEFAPPFDYAPGMTMVRVPVGSSAP